MTLNDLVVFAQSYDWNDHHEGGGWIVMGFGMVIFWLLVIVAVLWFVRTWKPAQQGPGGHPSAPESALEVLDRRLAEGAISVEEYEERRRVLTGHGSSG